MQLLGRGTSVQDLDPFSPVYKLQTWRKTLFLCLGFLLSSLASVSSDPELPLGGLHELIFALHFKKSLPRARTVFEKCLAAVLAGPQGNPSRNISCLSLGLGDYNKNLPTV